MKCVSEWCDWEGTLDESGRKNFYYTLCPECGTERPIPPRDIIKAKLGK